MSNLRVQMWRSLLAWSLAMGLVACATPGPVLTASVGTIRSGLGQAREQSSLAFTSTNDTAIALDIEQLLAGPAPNLTEGAFPVALDPKDIAAWNNAFSGLDRYLATLQKLVDPKRAAETGNQIDAIATELRDGAAGLKLPGAATEAFATFAQALVQAKAERTATAVMRRVNADFTAVMAGMADAIGDDDRSGLRLTTKAYWDKKLSADRVAYASIVGTGPGPTSQRRVVVLHFVDSMADRTAQLQDLESLRSSLLALGEAHSAAALGNNGDALFWIDRIGGWLDDIKRRTRAASAKGPAK
jgi:hypothetical protein